MNYIWKIYPSEESITSTTLTEPKPGCLTIVPLETEDSTEPDPTDTAKAQRAQEPIKKGRYKKDEANKSVAFHSKLYQDNIKRKIKTHFHNFIITFINCEIKKEWKIQKYKLRKMDSRITQNITIAFNKKLLKTPIKDVLSKVSMKFRDQSTNENFITKIISCKPHLAQLLNRTYEYIFTNFYLKSSSDMFKSASKDESFESHLNKIKDRDGEDYREKYYENAMQFIDFFENCKERCRKGKSKQEQ